MDPIEKRKRKLYQRGLAAAAALFSSIACHSPVRAADLEDALLAPFQLLDSFLDAARGPRQWRADLGSEIVMIPGMQITALTADGPLTITCGEGLKRSYTWEGATRSVEMWQRDKRWYGSFGIYYPGPGDHWKMHNGISRGVVEEGQQHFQSEEEALAWLRRRKFMPHVYTADGLVVGWGKTLPRRQLNVDVWQIYINGRKPEALPGSQDDKISVRVPSPDRRDVQASMRVTGAIRH